MNCKFLSLISVFILFTSLNLFAAEDAPASLQKLAPTLKEWGLNPILVNAVKAHNALGLGLADIKAKDEVWIKDSGISAFMKSIMENDAAKELARLEGTEGYFFECFLMGNQGANVAMTNKTSDYWQGDEEKWTESYKNGAGGIYFSKVKFDDSAQAYLVQISVPVMDGANAIGVITVGVNLDDFEANL